MKKTAKAADMGEGVLFAREECAGLLTRLLIIFIDLFVLLAFAAVLWTLSNTTMAANKAAAVLMLCWVAFAYSYLAVIESHSGTLGFLITGMKIVNLKGEKPSFVRMTGRLALWIIGPFNFVIDLLWVTNDRHKQTLRDKLAGTYVVMKGAVPCGRGRIHAEQYFLAGFSILFPEVRQQAPSPSEAQA